MYVVGVALILWEFPAVFFPVHYQLLYPFYLRVNSLRLRRFLIVKGVSGLNTYEFVVPMEKQVLYGVLVEF